MNLRNVDLNLLLVFHAMIEHRSVTRAAESMGLSQPATSAALNRLRSLLGDPLFVKAGTEMHPTPRAAELIQPVVLIMETIKGHTALSGLRCVHDRSPISYPHAGYWRDQLPAQAPQTLGHAGAERTP
ncbi:LysR family transcriptional regulator [Pseudomonas promysalinigenes]|uniref:LysR family transcriptional regulator n=1 Tax=Pseudomonas promysalinigenes TaxID=485898 RepID=UPI002722DB5A